MPATTRTQLLAVVAALGGALVVLAAVQRLGSSAFALAAAGAIALLLLARPVWALSALVGGVLLLEADPTAIIPGARLYDYLPGPKLTGVDALIGLAAAAVTLEAVRTKRVLALGPLGAALAVLFCGGVMGAVTGVAAGSTQVELQEGLRQLLPLLVVPVLVTQVVDTPERLRKALGLLAGMVLLKAALGLLTYLRGGSAGPGGGGFSATYFESTTNLLTMLFLLACLAAALARVPLAGWVRIAQPVAFLCLLLSFRRSFWIASVAGAALVALLGSGRTGRRLLVPALVVLVGAGYLVTTTRSDVLEGQLGQRVQQLNPSKIKANKEDRYRLGERRSVWDNIRSSPIAGLGLGQPWQQRFPLSEQHAGGNYYVHFGVLWWWMRLGILGPLGYLGVLVATSWTGLAVWRRTSDPVVGIAALGTAMGLVGFALAELTATFSGAEVRTSVLVATVAGLMSSAHRLTPRRPEPA